MWRPNVLALKTVPGTWPALSKELPFVVCCLSCSLPSEHLKGTIQGLFIFVFLAPRAVPGRAGCHIRAPHLRVWSHVSYFSIPPARRALFQPEEEKECFLPSLVPFGLLAQEGPKRPRSWGKPVSCGGLALLSRGSRTTCAWLGGV